MRIRLAAAAALLAGTAGCGSVLDVEPQTVVRDERAIVDAVSARSALAGAYDAMQSGSYYGEAFITYPELSSDNALHTGTFTTYADADQNALTADNSTVEGMWDAIYDAINRANLVIARIPGVPGLTDAEKNQMTGEAYLLRALHHFNATNLWGDVPIRTALVTTIEEASTVTRSPKAAVFTQIDADLTQASSLIAAQRSTLSGSIGAVRALQAKVALYQQNWAAAEAAANAVEALGYSLAPTFASLFDAVGGGTNEDILRIRFNDQDANLLGYYYLSRTYGGRRELAPTAGLDASYEAGDLRKAVTVLRDPSNRRYFGKFPTPAGTEHPHIIRFGEVLLIKAEAQARQNKLLEAVATYNRLRVRAGLPAHVLGVDVTTQAQVLAAIARERRSELAAEGDRWADLVRTGTVVSVMAIPATQGLYPIPQNERDVAPALTQNPGY